MGEQPVDVEAYREYLADSITDYLRETADKCQSHHYGPCVIYSYIDGKATATPTKPYPSCPFNVLERGALLRVEALIRNGRPL